MKSTLRRVDDGRPGTGLQATVQGCMQDIEDLRGEARAQQEGLGQLYSQYVALERRYQRIQAKLRAVLERLPSDD